jgi:hypothetical protein
MITSLGIRLAVVALAALSSGGLSVRPMHSGRRSNGSAVGPTMNVPCGMTDERS